MPAQPGPVIVGGGGSAATVTRVRWGRLLPVFFGITLVAFGIWSMSQGGTSFAPGGTVSGGGVDDAASEVDIARAARTPDLQASDATTDAAKPNADVQPPAAAPPAGRRVTPAERAPARAGGGRAGRRGAGAVAIGTGATSNATAATAVPRTVDGGGGAPSGELPMTGIETWIAAILGVLLLGVGIVVHVNAVRLAATAMLYRRGILLRPVDCARLAQERGLPQARVVLSNVLHRLLEEPAQGDFVAARLAR